MQSKEIEDSIIYWANQYMNTQKYHTTEDLLDGEFFHAILTREAHLEEVADDNFGFSLGHLETTLAILNTFYSEYDSIIHHSDYREIITNEIICNPYHIVLITELVIGVLIKSESDDKWVEQIDNMSDTHRENIVELIQKMSDLLHPSPQSSFVKRSMNQKEAPLKFLESNKEVVTLKKNNAELREWVLNLESENKRLENALKLAQTNLEQSVKANDELYKKYEQASKNRDYEKVKSECEMLESSLEAKEREIKALQLQHKDELDRLSSRGEDFKHEIEVLKEQLIKKKNEVNQLEIYKRIASRMDEVDKINLDLKANISELKDELKEKDRAIKQKEIEISNLNVNLEYRGKEIKDLKDKIVEIEADVTKYRNIKIDLQSQISQLHTDVKRLNEELDDRNRRLEYAEQMNFNEYSNDGLNFDLSERIKMLEEQNEELKNNHQHSNNMEYRMLETRLEELQREKKDLIRTNQRVQMKYERYEKEREAKMLAKDKIKLLQKELTTANMEKKRVSEQLLRSYQEISRLKIYENENKSLKKDRLDLLEELRKSNKENQKLQTKLICFFENNKYGDSQQDSDFESPINENHYMSNSRIFSNSKDKSQLEFNMDKSADLDDDEFYNENSKSMMISNNHKKNISLSKYLNGKGRLNETVVSSDRNMNRFKKKFILEKDKEIEDKNKEIEEISKKYEDKIQELNKSRNEERTKYEQKLQGLSSNFKTFSHKRRGKHLTQRANTPVSVLNDFLPTQSKPSLDLIEDESDDQDDDEEPKSNLFSKLEEMTGRYETLRKSIASQINDNHRDSETVHDMVTKIFDDDGRHYHPTTKST